MNYWFPEDNSCDIAFAWLSSCCLTLALSWAWYSKVFLRISSWRATLSSSASLRWCRIYSFCWSIYWSRCRSSCTLCSACRLFISNSNCLVFLRSSSAICDFYTSSLLKIWKKASLRYILFCFQLLSVLFFKCNFKCWLRIFRAVKILGGLSRIKLGALPQPLFQGRLHQSRSSAARMPWCLS